MKRRKSADIHSIGPPKSYSDGAEEVVSSILAEATDVSDGSDELKSRISDWGTTYHFSPSRSNILRPFNISSELRILEIGAGTGAVTRHLGERGASVLALEGDPARAEAAALRCADLENVEVICGALGDLEDANGFDLVVVIGVLEYAGGRTPGDTAQIEFLQQAVDLLRPTGALVLAIENQLGLKYLLGYAEDHLSEPWAGIEDYPGNPPVHTFSRRALRGLLERSGAPAQRWLFPFPDYKLPKAILTEELYGHTHCVEIIDQLVGNPILDLANPPSRFCDDRASHLAFLDAGLGLEVANSFLVIAGRDQASIEALIDDRVLAWHFSSDRRRPLRRTQTLNRLSSGLRVRSSREFDQPEETVGSWLGHAPEKDEEFLIGQTLEQLAMDACRRNDVDDLETILRRWHDDLLQLERPSGVENDDDNPFRPDDARRELPSEFLDVSLSNFITTDSALEFIDREWLAGASVDPNLVRFRALWYFALGLVTSGSAQPFAPDATVNSIAVRLWELIGHSPDAAILETLFPAESALQEFVTGEESVIAEANLRQLGSLSRSEKQTASTLPISRIRHDAVQLREMLDGEKAQAEKARMHLDHLESELDRLRTEADDSRAYQQKLEREIENRRTFNGTATYAKKLEGGLKEMRAAARDALEYQHDLETELGLSRAESKKAAAHLQHLETQIEEIQENADGSKKYQLQLETELSLLSAESKKAAAHLHHLEIEIEEKRENAEGSKQYQRQLEAELEHARSASAEAGAYVNRLEAEIEQSNIDSAAARDYQRHLESEIKRLEATAEEASSDRQRLAAEAVETNVILTATNDQLRESRSRLAVLELQMSRRLVRAALAIPRLFGGSRAKT